MTFPRKNIGCAWLTFPFEFFFMPLPPTLLFFLNKSPNFRSRSNGQRTKSNKSLLVDPEWGWYVFQRNLRNHYTWRRFRAAAHSEPFRGLRFFAQVGCSSAALLLKMMPPFVTCETDNWVKGYLDKHRNCCVFLCCRNREDIPQRSFVVCRKRHFEIDGKCSAITDGTRTTESDERSHEVRFPLSIQRNC